MMQVLQKLLRLWDAARHPLTQMATFLNVLFGLSAGAILFSSSLGASKPTELIIQSGALALIAFAALFAVIIREVQHARHRTFANTLTFRTSAREKLSNLDAFTSWLTDNANSGTPPSDIHFGQFRALLEDIITEYRNVFTQMTGKNCRLCIKVIDVSTETPIVHTLIRDHESAKLNKNNDLERSNKLIDKLENNTDFIRLFDSKIDDQGYYFSNDLSIEDEYNTTSLDYWQSVRDGRSAPPKNNWPLPYSSTIVWPIRQDAREDLGIPNPTCIGFLAVDSPSKRAFNQQWDEPIGRALALQLYPIIEMHSRLTRASNRTEPGN